MAHLLFITTKTSWGGSEQLWCDVAERALGAGDQVSVVMPKPDKLHPRHERLAALGARVLFRPPRMRPTLLRRVVWRLGKVTQPETQWWHEHFLTAPDVTCVSQGGSYCAISMPGLIPWLNGSPYILVCQSNRTSGLPPMECREEVKNLFGNATKVCFVAEENLRSAARFLAMDLPNANVIQNPVNLAGVSAVAWPEESPLRLACVARLEIRDKGQDLLLEAPAPPWSDRQFEMNFFGGGADGPIIQDLIQQYDLGQKAELVGFEADIRKIWASHLLLLLPSLSEGTPLSLIEAQLCGRPALVTRVDGNPDWVKDDITGFIAEAPTVHHLTIALERAWQARDRWREMGEAARAQCVAKRDSDPPANLLDILHQSIER